jgi:hypothetical protein
MSLICCSELAHIEELIKQVAASAGKPSYSFGHGGAVTVLTWLDSGNSIPSNKTGIPFGLNNGLLTSLWVGNELLVAYDLSVYWHLGDETSLTLLKTVTVPNTARTKTFDAIDLGVVNVPVDVQIAMRVTAVPGTNPKNMAAHATISGTS